MKTCCSIAPGEQELKKKNRRQQEENGFIVYWIFIFVLFSVKVLQIKTCLSANNRVVSRGESDLKLSLFQAELRMNVLLLKYFPNGGSF